MLMNFAQATLFTVFAVVPGLAGDIASIQGKLLIEPGKAAILRTPEKDVPLSSGDKEIASTFKDTRISGRELKLEGQFRNDGVFEVREFYVVRPDSLYRLIYFCDT